MIGDRYTTISWHCGTVYTNFKAES